MIRECVVAHCWVLVPTLMTGQVSHDAFWSMLVKLAPSVPRASRRHLTSGAVSFDDSVLLMQQVDSHRDRSWSCTAKKTRVCLLQTHGFLLKHMAALNFVSLLVQGIACVMTLALSQCCSDGLIANEHS
jgi:hypothetical protein